MDGQVRMRRDSKWAMGTYLLESMHGQTSQDAERIQVGKGEGWEHRWMDESGHRKNLSEQGCLPPREHGWMDESGHESE